MMDKIQNPVCNILWSEPFKFDTSSSFIHILEIQVYQKQRNSSDHMK
jgi:hypothetical protein